ncbi:hypothetical protein D9M73_167840 [compost metagenome]
MLALGIVYMLVARRWLEPGAEDNDARPPRRTFRDLIRDYRLAGRERRLRIRPDSLLIGFTLPEEQLRTHHGANVIAVERIAKLRRKILNPSSAVQLQAGDVLLVDLLDPAIDHPQFYLERGLEPLRLDGE